MDARVNDFLNEINEIAPLNETKSENGIFYIVIPTTFIAFLQFGKDV